MLFILKVKFLHRQSPGQQCLQCAVLSLTSQLGLSVVPMLTVKLGGGGNNIFEEDAPPLAQYPCQYLIVNTSRMDLGFRIFNALEPILI